MKPNSEEVFARLRDHGKLKEWLQAHRDSAIEYLTKAGDMVTVHRAQGKVAFIDEMLEKLGK